ncbi:3-oxoacyl-[acyl-carrier-protein] reductase FabG [Diabrotica virgifera virgifera]|uniref:Uncharacterized protein LOC114331209 n=1 Tax=Diabrotica virgifera virgifera TaxID=50390 RepID=A0A6P7FK42_DIAVI|nr:3-oxoacyl-[acyl-carrier-protein] reductase FabG [Diabrotica virgifera virgifera]
MSISFKGKVVLVSGGSSGLGGATAKRFGRLGANVAIAHKNIPGDTIEEVVAEISKFSTPLVIECDLTDSKQIEHVVNQTVKHFGKIDVLVNAAGILQNGSIENTTLEMFDKVMNINVRAMFEMIRVCTPHLIKTQGAIVNISSVTGLRAFPGVLAYCISKSAVDQLTRCVALELASKQVRCNSVNPGVIDTILHKRSGLNDEQYKAFLEKSRLTHALGRAGTAEEVASGITFLASTDASFVTGNNFRIDGGRGIMCPR